jgi:cell division protein FtsQ
MRRVGRLSLRARGHERRPLPRRWHILLKRLGLAAAIALLLGGGSVWAVRSGAMATVADAGRALIAGSTGAIGLTIAEAFSEGRERTDPAALAAALQPFVGRSTLLLDIGEVREQVEALPWVKHATVAKMLPDMLFVHLEEHEAVALWYDGERTVLVGADGALLPVRNIAPFVHLKLLNGDHAPEAAADLVAMLQTQPDMATRVSAATRIGGRRWNLYIDGRIEVRLPEAAPEAAWQRLAELERAGELTGRAIVAVDLRSAGWTAIRLRTPPRDDRTEQGA